VIGCWLLVIGNGLLVIGGKNQQPMTDNLSERMKIKIKEFSA
jgi:hypothetical protein